MTKNRSSNSSSDEDEDDGDAGVVSVTLLVHAEVSIGETVCVCLLSTSSSSSFTVEQSREMYTDPSQFPVWRLDITLPRRRRRRQDQELVRYRYLTTGRRQLLAWEPQVSDMQPRMLRLSPGKLPVLDYFGVAPPPLSRMSSLDSGPQRFFRHQLAPALTAASKKIVLIAFHLPFKLYYKGTSSRKHEHDQGGEEEEEEVWECEYDLDDPAATSIGKGFHVKYIGAVTPKVVFGLDDAKESSSPPMDAFFAFSPARKRGITAALAKFNCLPVFLPKDVYVRFYGEFCKEVLWDVFHNVLTMPSWRRQQEESSSGGGGGAFEQGYIAGNQMFAQLAIDLLDGNEIVWVHSYHLMLLPKMLSSSSSSSTTTTAFCTGNNNNNTNGGGFTVIFFLHVPFPTSEVFRTLPMREQLLDGMLSASTVGFHTFNHARHFLTCCRRFLGAQSRSYGENGSLAVEYGQLRVLITISHLGVDEHRIDQALKHVPQPPLITADGTVGVVFGSLDELQRLKGVSLKLLAFERFLEQFPAWRVGGGGRRARFLLWTTSSSSTHVKLPAASRRIKDSSTCLAEVRALVDRINDQYGGGGDEVVQHKHFFHAAPSFEQRIHLWLQLDVFVSTPVSEGLNLLPMEFMLANKAHPGAVILSEFSACASVLNGAVCVGCYDIDRIAKALLATATMSKEEKLARFMRDVDSIRTPTSVWAQHVIAEAVNVLEDTHFHFIEPTPVRMTTLSAAAQPVFSLARLLPFAQVARSTAQAQRRLVLLDLRGTLVELEDCVLGHQKKDFLGALGGAGLSAQMRDCLAALCGDHRNLVFVISRDSRQVLTRVFFPLLRRNLGLMAHSGLCLRFPDNTHGEEDDDNAAEQRRQELELRLRRQTIWEEKLAAAERAGDGDGEEEEKKDEPVGATMAAAAASPSRKIAAAAASPSRASSSSSSPQQQPAFDATRVDEWRATVDVAGVWQQWMETSGIQAILHRYTWITTGSTCVQCDMSASWEYAHADPEFGLIQARLLVQELEQAIACARLNISVRHTKNAVDLLPSGVNKGFAVRKLMGMLPALKPTWNGQAPDFCLVVGDGSTDEPMFTAVHQLFRSLEASQSKVYTATVGRKPTTARYYLPDTSAVAQLLASIVEEV